MTGEPPVLDARSLTQIVQQLLAQADGAFTGAPGIPRWRLARRLDEARVQALLAQPFDDPGLMLALSYARLLELSLQRLNRVFEKNLLVFLDTMGVRLLPPAPADVPLTFALTPGTPPTRVPRGTQAATQAAGTSPGVVFETVDDLTVVPATLAAGLTVDPTWDRYTDLTSRLDASGPFGFLPFVGERPLPHRLYLGDAALLEVGRQATVIVELAWRSPEPIGAVRRFFEQLVYRGRLSGVLQTVTATAVSVTPGRARVRFDLPGPLDVESVQGVGLESGLESRWLRAELGVRFPDEPVARSIEVTGSAVRATSAGVLPDLAFANTAPLDLSTDFLPFGETPVVGDAFYLASTEAFGKPAVEVVVRIGRTPVPAPTLRWEYSTLTGEREQAWRPFTVVQVDDDGEFEAAVERLTAAFGDPDRQPVPFLVDGTAGFTRDGRIAGLATDMFPIRHQGVSASWVRVRIADGGYPAPPVLAQYVIATVTGRRPPEIGYVDDQQVDVDQPFEPFGPTPNRADVFAFGEVSRRFPTEVVNDRQAFVVAIDVGLGEERTRERGAPDVRWEYLGPGGWTEPPDVVDGTLGLRRPGTVELTVTDAVRGEVNGQAGCWLRGRLDSGGYGRPADFEAVDPDDPKQGFRIRAGTGDLQPPRLRSVTLDYDAQRDPVVLTENGFLFERPTGSFSPFVSVRDLRPATRADRDPTFYLGLDEAFPGRPVSLHVAAAARAFTGSVVRTVGAAPLPSSAPTPLRWEYFKGTDWSELTVNDGTSGLTTSGRLEFLMPADTTPLAKHDRTPRHWVRARSRTNDPFDTQELDGVFLNAVPAVQAVTVRDETVGSSNGRAGQQLRLARPPVLPGQQVLIREPELPTGEERAAILAAEGPDAILLRPDPLGGAPQVWVRWHQVGTFLRSELRSRHYLIDPTTGLLTFGDGRRGMIPPPATDGVVADYRSGGGAAGNVPAGTVVKIQNPVPGVSSVLNPVAADGGATTETAGQALERGPQTLRHRGRAVSASDLTWLARQAAGTRVARVSCLTNVNRELRFEPGWVTLVVVPDGTGPRLTPSAQLVRAVQDHIVARASAGSAADVPPRINVIGPGYLQVTVAADVVPVDFRESEEVRQRAIGALDAFFHPLTGGSRGTGWEFARDVYESEVSQVLEDVPGLSHVRRLELLANQAQHGLAVGPVTIDRVVPPGTPVASHDGLKVALLAEALETGQLVDRLAVTGVREGDRLTRALDLTVADPVGATTVTVDGVARPAFAVVAPAPDAVGVPHGSRLATVDGAGRTRLARAIPRARPDVVQVAVEDRDFVDRLRPGDRLTAFHPFPLTVRGLDLDWPTEVQTLRVEPYETPVSFPARSTMTTLDNRVRLPLAGALPADTTVTVVGLSGFAEGERITVGDGRLGPLQIRRIDRITDVVYLDESALVHPGSHRITPRADPREAVPR